MGWVSRLFGGGGENRGVPNRDTEIDVIPWGQRRRFSGEIDVEIVGESNYQSEIERAVKAAGRNYGMVYVVTEPDNEFDNNAVRIMSKAGETLGYLPRQSARRYQPVIAAVEQTGNTVTCEAQFAGGGRGKSFGIWLGLLKPSEIRLDD